MFIGFFLSELLCVTGAWTVVFHIRICNPFFELYFRENGIINLYKQNLIPCPVHSRQKKGLKTIYHNFTVRWLVLLVPGRKKKSLYYYCRKFSRQFSIFLRELPDLSTAKDKKCGKRTEEMTEAGIGPKKRKGPVRRQVP